MILKDFIESNNINLDVKKMLDFGEWLYILNLVHHFKDDECFTFQIPFLNLNVQNTLLLEIEEVFVNDKQRIVDVKIDLNQNNSLLKNIQFKYKNNRQNFCKVSNMIEKRFLKVFG